MLLVFRLILFLKLSSNKISDTQLSEGANLNTQEKKEIKFDLFGEEHKITIDSVGDTSVDLTIQSNPIQINLKLNEEKKIDLNDDDIYDLKIKLTSISIYDKKVTIYIKKTHEPTCTESWTCGDWSTCVNGTQSKTCEDINDCGRAKSNESRNCIVPIENLTCSQKGGVICTSSQNCSINFINSSNGNKCCLGNCTSQSQEMLNCGINIDCFIDASEDCTLANLTNNLSINFLGWVQNQSAYYEIRGLESNKCLLYTKILNVFGKYDNETRQGFLNQNMTNEEIDQQEQQMNTALATTIGKYGICKYPVSNLTKLFTDLKAGNISGSSSDTENYNCTGTIYS